MNGRNTPPRLLAAVGQPSRIRKIAAHRRGALGAVNSVFLQFARSPSILGSCIDEKLKIAENCAGQVLARVVREAECLRKGHRMKKLEAIISPSKLHQVKAALTSDGVIGLTISEVRRTGADQQHVERYRSAHYAV